jgi:hypothetical protein
VSPDLANEPKERTGEINIADGTAEVPLVVGLLSLKHIVLLKDGLVAPCTSAGLRVTKKVL